MKRIFLFLATNVAVMVVLSIAMRVLGVESILAQNGTQLDLRALLIFSGVVGFAGSFISLLTSKFAAKMMTRARVITNPANATESWLVNTVARQASAAGIGTPEVAIYDSPEVNAFATGASRNNALVAVSSGLLSGMRQNEVEAVLAHEVSHVANGDMVTMALLQGVVNTFVIFLSRVVGFFVDRVILRNERGMGIGFFVSSLIAQIVLGILASTIVMWFSRQREFRADAGAAKLAGSTNMIAALERLGQIHQPPALPESLAAFGIAGGVPTGMKKLFMSHPPLSERIQALKQA
jgi:heat shock protein HtpX